MLPDWVKDGGPIAIVALGAIWMFLQAFNKWGTSRDAEREAFLSAMEKQSDDFTSAVLSLVGLATRMVDGCQSHTPIKHRLKTTDVIEAADPPRS